MDWMRSGKDERKRKFYSIHISGRPRRQGRDGRTIAERWRSALINWKFFCLKIAQKMESP
jgi:hypothetical protein